MSVDRILVLVLIVHLFLCLMGDTGGWWTMRLLFMLVVL